MSDDRDAAGFDCLLAEVVRGREFCETPCECCHGRLLEELADLIDPDTTKSPELTTKCDRDALLALAGEILENADLSRELHDEMLNEKRLDMALTFHEYACELREYAIRIREALGVTFGGRL